MSSPLLHTDHVIDVRLSTEQILLCERLPSLFEVGLLLRSPVLESDGHLVLRTDDVHTLLQESDSNGLHLGKIVRLGVLEVSEQRDSLSRRLRPGQDLLSVERDSRVATLSHEEESSLLCAGETLRSLPGPCLRHERRSIVGTNSAVTQRESHPEDGLLLRPTVEDTRLDLLAVTHQSITRECFLETRGLLSQKVVLNGVFLGTAVKEATENVETCISRRGIHEAIAMQEQLNGCTRHCSGLDNSSCDLVVNQVQTLSSGLLTHQLGEDATANCVVLGHECQFVCHGLWRRIQPVVDTVTRTNLAADQIHRFDEHVLVRDRTLVGGEGGCVGIPRLLVHAAKRAHDGLDERVAKDSRATRQCTQPVRPVLLTIHRLVIRVDGREGRVILGKLVGECRRLHHRSKLQYIEEDLRKRLTQRLRDVCGNRRTGTGPELHQVGALEANPLLLGVTEARETPDHVPAADDLSSELLREVCLFDTRRDRLVSCSGNDDALLGDDVEDIAFF